MTTPLLAGKRRPEEGAWPATNPSPLTAAETVLMADLARACALLDERLSGARASEENAA